MKELKLGVCIPGFNASGLRSGKYGVALIFSDTPCEYAAVYTKNHVKAAPIELMISHKGKLQAIFANSGNANCCNKKGLQDAKTIQKKISEFIGIRTELVGVGSTGIIGRPIDVDQVLFLGQQATKTLDCSPQASIDAAQAIKTTDTHYKMFCVEENGVYVGGICKGSGMIDPSMATMLCYITTNAQLGKTQLKKVLSQVVDETFNMICVDGDMSTNDMVVVMSNQSKKCLEKKFQKLLFKVCDEFSKMMAFDGEGATKNVTVEVTGCKTEKDAKNAVKAIANSNLVKTALYGSNPNWGRITAAVGTVVKYDWKKASVTYRSGEISYKILDKGKGMDLKPAENLLKNRELTLTVNLGMGREKAVGYTCDLSEEYIRINAEYS